MSQIAKNRWKILSKVIQKKALDPRDLPSCSKRSFTSYNLLQMELEESEEGADWYIFNLIENHSINVRILKPKLQTSHLIGFNNTGNICIWSSEECLALYIIKHKAMFAGKKVLELGGGQTCLAGLTAASVGGSEVVLTDGNSDSVENLQQIISRNQDLSLSAKQYSWSENRTDGWEGQFDILLCADCLFFQEGREDLANEMYRLLKPGGFALVIAPERSGTFTAFKHLIQGILEVEVIPEYDAEVEQAHSDLINKDFYDTDVHYPKFMILTKST